MYRNTTQNKLHMNWNEFNDKKNDDDYFVTKRSVLN